MHNKVRIRNGYFAGRVGICLGKSVLSAMCLVKFPDNCFVLSFTQDNVEVV